MVLTPQQEAELQFWRGLLGQHGSVKDYLEFRSGELYEKTRYFPGFYEQKGPGLDLGCGLVSVLEAVFKRVVCVDPLMDFYFEMIPVWARAWLNKHYLRGDGEDLMAFPDESLEWVFCVNVIDHTPHPDKMLGEIRRVLRDGGRLYFEVNFDDGLGGPHYHLVRETVVEAWMGKIGWKQISKEVVRLNEHRQSRFWAVYQK
jgi:SAM-dependent methyltransferase